MMSHDMLHPVTIQEEDNSYKSESDIEEENDVASSKTEHVVVKSESDSEEEKESADLEKRGLGTKMIMQETKNFMKQSSNCSNK